MDSNISGFFSPVDGYGSPDLASFTRIPTSEIGMCDLYRGERAGRFRVYKCLKPQYRGSLVHEGILKKEFEQGYSLRHINICEIYSFMEIEGLGNCIEMEWVDGVSLEEFLRRGLPGERTFRKLAVQLCDALSYMHSRGQIHRDIKPSNIMVSHDGGTVKLIDFGLSDSPSSTIFKTPAGSLKWVAPEVLAGGKADVKSDIYSLGAVLRVMTSGHRNCLARCTAADPAKRYKSAEEVREALFRPTWILPVAVAAALLLIAIALLLLGRRRALAKAVTLPAADTVYVLPAKMEETVPAGNPAQNSPSRPDKKQPSEHKQDRSIDEIFEQASDLFEENL